MAAALAKHMIPSPTCWQPSRANPRHRPQRCPNTFPSRSTPPHPSGSANSSCAPLPWVRPSYSSSTCIEPTGGCHRRTPGIWWWVCRGFPYVSTRTLIHNLSMHSEHRADRSLSSLSTAHTQYAETDLLLAAGEDQEKKREEPASYPTGNQVRIWRPCSAILGFLRHEAIPEAHIHTPSLLILSVRMKSILYPKIFIYSLL